jgi:hypothetical protein
MVSRNQSYDLIDIDGDIRARALYAEHMSLAGRWVPLAVRWVDVMPACPVPTMAAQLQALREAREARGIRHPATRSTPNHRLVHGAPTRAGPHPVRTRADRTAGRAHAR